MHKAKRLAGVQVAAMGPVSSCTRIDLEDKQEGGAAKCMSVIKRATNAVRSALRGPVHGEVLVVNAKHLDAALDTVNSYSFPKQILASVTRGVRARARCD